MYLVPLILLALIGFTLLWLLAEISKQRRPRPQPVTRNQALLFTIALLIFLVVIFTALYRQGVRLPVWVWTILGSGVGIAIEWAWRQSQVSPPSWPDSPPSTPKSGGRFDYLVLLLQGDRQAAERLANQAGSVELAIEQLLRDRR